MTSNLPSNLDAVLDEAAAWLEVGQDERARACLERVHAALDKPLPPLVETVFSWWLADYPQERLPEVAQHLRDMALRIRDEGPEFLLG